MSIFKYKSDCQIQVFNIQVIWWGKNSFQLFFLIENDLVYFRMSFRRQQINDYQKVTRWRENHT